MNECRLYFRYVGMEMRGQMQYKGWWVQILTVLFTVLTDPIEALLLFDRFGAVGEWTVSRVMLMYGMAIFCFGLAETLVGRGFDAFPSVIRTGGFDRILLRPRSLFVQTAAARFHLHRLARVTGGAVIIWLALRAQRMPLTPGNVTMLVCALLGGFLTYVGVFVLTAAPTFYTVEGAQFTYIFTNGSYQVAKVPPVYLPDWLRRLFLYVVPMFAFCYLPAGAMCGWGVSRISGWLALPIGALFCALSYGIWLLCARHYTSTGS